MGAHLDPHLRFIIFTVACALVLFAGGFFLFRSQHLDKWQVIALSLIVGGGVGNLIDRALRGWVVDFLNIGIGDFRTGIFNVADMAIVLGFCILLFSSSYKNGNKSRTKLL
jgi:signal peptidase II